MQEINLLQNKVKDRTLQFERSNRLVVVLFTLIVIFEMAAVGGLYLLISSTKTKAAEVNKQNIETQKSMNANQKDLVLAQGLQAQLKNVRTLLADHIYWSAFLDQVSKITPTKVQFQSITGSTTDNKLHVEGLAKSYQDVGILLLSLATSDKFKEVKLRSVTPGQGAEFGYSFSLEITVAPSIFNKQ
jgi:Tfp pilus assembly protein PilN